MRKTKRVFFKHRIYIGPTAARMITRRAGAVNHSAYPGNTAHTAAHLCWLLVQPMSETAHSRPACHWLCLSLCVLVLSSTDNAMMPRTWLGPVSASANFEIVTA